MIKKTFANTAATVWETIYEVPNSKKADWVLLYAVNEANSTEDFSLRVYKASADTTLPIFVNKPLASNEFFKIGGGYNEFIALQNGDKIESLTSGDTTILVSLIEYNDIIQGG